MENINTTFETIITNLEFKLNKVKNLIIINKENQMNEHAKGNKKDYTILYKLYFKAGQLDSKKVALQDKIKKLNLWKNDIEIFRKCFKFHKMDEVSHPINYYGMFKRVLKTYKRKIFKHRKEDSNKIYEYIKQFDFSKISVDEKIDSLIKTFILFF